MLSLTWTGMFICVWRENVWMRRNMESTPRPSARKGTIWVEAALNGRPRRAAKPDMA